MKEHEPSISLVAQVGEALGIGRVVPDAYHDLLQPSMQEFGGSILVIARAVRMALAPLEGAVWGYDQVRSWLSVRLAAKLAKTPAERITSPPVHLAGPALLQLHFAANEEALREMYANLLATSMDSERSSAAHPAYVSVIQQLSPDEARVLSRVVETGETLFHGSGEGRHRLPSVEYVVVARWREFCSAIGVSDAVGDLALDNFVRLRLFRWDVTSEAIFRPAGHNRYGDYEASVEQAHSAALELTDFGRQFMTACVIEPGSPPPW